MPSSFDIFFSGNDREVVASRYQQVTVSTTNWTLAAEGNLLTTGAGSNGFALGSVVLLRQSGKPDAYLYVAKKVSDTSVYVVPLRSALDSAGAIGTVYTNTATLTAGINTATRVYETGATLVVDLTDAPGASYTYLICADATVSHSQGSRVVTCVLRSEALVDDPLSGSAIGEAVLDVTNAGTESWLYNAVREVTLAGGQRYEFHLQVANNSTAGRARLQSAHLLALRVDGWTGYVRSTSNMDGAATNAANTTDQTHATVTATATATHVAFVAGLVGHSSATAADRIAEVKVKVGGSTVQSARIKLPATTSRVPIGFLAAISPSSGNAVALTVNNQGASGNAFIEKGIVAIASLASLPTWLAAQLNNSQSAATVSAPDEYTDGAVSAGQTIVAGMHIEVITTGGGIATGTTATDYYNLRPVWAGDYAEDQAVAVPPLEYENDTAARGWLGHPGVSATSVANSMNFFLWRGKRVAASGSQNIVQAKWRGVSHDVYVGATRFLWLREAEPAAVTPRAIILDPVEIERGLVYKAWDQTGTTGLYQLSLPDVKRVSRCLLNGVEMTRATVQASAPKLTTANTWGWDGANRKAYVYMPSTPSGRTPADDRETIVLCAEEFVASRTCTLIDDDGEYRPYTPELTESPEVTSELQIRDAGTTVVTSLGDLSLANADARWDDIAMRENFAGLRATIRRGPRGATGVNNQRLRELQVLARAVLDVPQIERKGSEFQIGLFDQMVSLRRPLADSKVTVYEGTGTASAPRDYVPLPIVYGMKVRRVPAYRVTDDALTPSEHWFKVAEHAVVAFGSVYANADDTTPITTGYSPGAADLLAAQFKVKSAGGGGDDAFTSDVLYVDVLGGVGGGLENVGTIIEHLLTNYPLRVDEYAGSPSTTIITSTHTSAAAGATCNVTSTTGFAVGDRVLVVSHASAATFYHGVVTAIGGATSMTIVPGYQTGDAVVGTGFTVGANSKVQKVVFAGGLALTDLARASLRLYDRRWRRKYSGGAYIPDAPDLNLLLDPSSTIEDALALLMRTFGYVFANPVGRVEVGVPDEDAGSVARNPGFEFDLVTSPASSRSAWPWFETGGLTSAITTSIKASGQQAIELSRPVLGQDGGFAQDVILPQAGDHVAPSVLVALRSGDGSAVRLGFSDPSSPLREQLSDPFEVQSGVWTRVAVPFEVPRGSAGRARVRLLPHYPRDRAPLPTALGSYSGLTFTPSASVVGWLRASDVTPAGLGPGEGSGSKLTTWDAYVGADATASGNARPRWWRRACFEQPAVVFDDVNDTMAWITVSAAPYSIFIVYAPTDTTAAYHRALSGGSANWLMGPHKGGGSTLLYNAYTGGSGGATGGYVGAGLACDQPNAFACCALIASSSSLATHYVNGSSVGTNTATSQAAPGVLNLGKGGAVSESLFGRIAEVIVLNRAVTDAVRQGIEEYLMRTYGIRSATVAVDDFRIFPVAAVLDRHNSAGFPAEFDPDTFYEAQVSFDVSTQDPLFASYIRITDSEAQALTTAISQAKNALPNAQRLIVEDLLVTDAYSAAGIAAAYASYFARPRSRLRIAWVGPTRVPKVGERVFHRDNRVPELADRNPVHLLVGTKSSGGNVVELITERQNDFVSDRLSIAASDFPVGLIFVTTSSTCPGSGYSEEVIGMRGYYLVGAATADLTSVHGSPTHRHSLAHTHPVGAHSHTFNIPSQTLGDPDGDADLPLYASSVGPHSYRDVARGLNDSGGPHQHGAGPSNGRATANASPTSQSAEVYTFYGSNDVTWRRVLFCKRVGGSGNFPTDMILGYNGAAAAPPGWNLCDAGGGRPDLRGYALRGAQQWNDGTDTTIKAATTHTQTNDPAGNNLDLTDPSRVVRHARLRIVNGASSFHGVVVVGPGEEGLAADRCKVQSLHVDGDTADGTVYVATGSAVEIDDQRANVAVTVANHRHAVSGSVGTGAVPSHTHTAPHEHAATATFFADASAGTVNAEMDTFGAPHYSLDGHQHAFLPTLPTHSSASSAAGGDITSTSAHAPDRYQMPFIIPADSSQNVLPVLAVAWSDDVCPEGFEHLSAADGLLIVGAGAGVAAGALVTGHVHTFDAASHAYTHNHGGSATLNVDPDYAPGGDTWGDTTMIENPASSPTGRYGTTAWDAAWGPWYEAANAGHRHSITINTIQNTAATMTAQSSLSSGTVTGTASLPPSRRLVTCVKA